MTDVNLPQWGMGMADGTIVEWLKSEGDLVALDEELVEVEAEKVTGVVLAPASGVLSRILVTAGQTIPVFTTLAVIDEVTTRTPAPS